MNTTAAGIKLVITNILFPGGRTIDEAADDVAFINVSRPTLGNVQVGLNGHQVDWDVANVLQIDVAVIPNSGSDKALKLISTGGRIQGGSIPTPIYSTISIVEADGTSNTYVNMKLTDGDIANSTSTDGSLATRTYTFQGVNRVL